MVVLPLICFTLSIYVVHANNEPLITLPDGTIKGVTISSYTNFTYYAYVGIPFASPPIGKLRFQPPQPPQKWNGILDGRNNDKKCFQVNDNSHGQTEDCLYLNVYTPVKPQNKALLPVMVNIYGGSFVHGSASGLYKGQTVVEKGVIVVTMNYRVGPFGFLSTGDKVIPGNMGLKDQQLALKWVQRNIHLFGGDPKKVTLMGQSAGAASVTYQILSPSSAGLFRAAIAQSASALCNWAYQQNAVDTAYGIASRIDKHFTRQNTTTQLLALLLNADANAIKNTEDQYHVFAPVIEVDHEGAMITRPMYQLVQEGRINKVPLLTGITSEESLSKIENMSSWRRYQEKFDKDPSYLIDENMGIKDAQTKAIVSTMIKNIYTNATFTEDLAASIRYYSDDKFTRATIRYAQLQAQHTDVYFYQFSYHGALGNNSDYLKGAGRVKHAEDLRYFWSYYKDYSKFPESDMQTLRRYVALLTNFAKTLNPTPKPESLLQNLTWPKLTSKRLIYLDIDESLSLKENPRSFSYPTWVEIFEKYAKKPYISF